MKTENEFENMAVAETQSNETVSAPDARKVLEFSGSPYISVRKEVYQESLVSNTNGMVTEWVLCEDETVENASSVYLYRGQEKTVAVITVDKSRFNLDNDRVIEAKLIFTPMASNNSSEIYVNYDGSRYTHDDSLPLEWDVTAAYNSFQSSITMVLETPTPYTESEFSLPTLRLVCSVPSCHSVTKSFPCVEGASVEYDILTGEGMPVIEDISDDAMGIRISHIFPGGCANSPCGKGFRLNIEDSLQKVTGENGEDATYVYTDSFGMVYPFKEYFYYKNAEGERVDLSVDKSSILTDADGRLWYGGNEVFRELKTDSGIEVSTRLEGTNNAEWIEQRLEEEKKAEEQVRSCESTLKKFVVVEKSTGEERYSLKQAELDSADAYEQFMANAAPDTVYLLSEDEAISFHSLLTQKNSMQKSREAINVQMQNLVNTAKSLYFQYYAEDGFGLQEASLNVETAMINYEDNLDTANDGICATRRALVGEVGTTNLLTKRGFLSNQVMNRALQKQVIALQISQFPLGMSYPEGQPNTFPAFSGVGSLTAQYINLGDQLTAMDEQMDCLNEQIAAFAKRSAEYKVQLSAFYKDYCVAKNEYLKIKAQVPVAYLLSEDTVRGYNTAGEPVLWQDKHGAYVAIEREVGENAFSGCIRTLYDNKERVMQFLYNTQGYLTEIVTSDGKKTSFEYDANGYLTKIDRAQYPSLEIAYTEEDKIAKLTADTQMSISFGYNGESLLTELSRSVVSWSNQETVIHSVVFTHTDEQTEVVEDLIRGEIYFINSTNNRVDRYYRLVNGKVAEAEIYTYTDDKLTKKEVASGYCLNLYTKEEFFSHFESSKMEEYTYNSFDLPRTVKTSYYEERRIENPNPAKVELTTYEYDTNQKVKSVRTAFTQYSYLTPVHNYTTVETFRYNQRGDLVCHESYIEGEESITGIVREEHFYDKNGYLTRSCTYNSLDPSSKFYTENEVDEQGRVIAAWDESGKHRTAYDLGANGTTRTLLPNGSAIGYGTDAYGRAVSLTHSTEIGEENTVCRGYTKDALTRLSNGKGEILYTRDFRRRVTNVSLNGLEDYFWVDYTGDNTDNELTTVYFWDGTPCHVVKNAHGDVTEVAHGNHIASYTYNNNRQLTRVTDSTTGTTELVYNYKGVLARIEGALNESSTTNPKEQIIEKRFTGSGVNHTYTYTYKDTADGALDTIGIGTNTVHPLRDLLGRNTGKTVCIEGETPVITEQISYLKYGDHATHLPSTIRYGHRVYDEMEPGFGRMAMDETLKYRYDSMGNVVEVLKNGTSFCRYAYDALGRLLREDNRALGKTTAWVYDNCGNILARYEYAYTNEPTEALASMACVEKTYRYDDRSDKLLYYGNEGFKYDEMARPTLYRGKAMTWENVKDLTSYDGNTFAYDARGRRITKNQTSFVYDAEGRLLRQTTSTDAANTMDFYYDHTGVCAVRYLGTKFFYRKNAQGDVIALLDSNGNLVVEYTYDAWGKCTVDDKYGIGVGEANPFRYRSYYYDTETGFYFLQSRYYDPETGRFISPDDLSYLDPDSVNGLNLYAYCLNNPIMYTDPDGHMPNWIKWLIGGIAFVGAVVLTALSGGALTPVFVGMGVSILSGGLIQGTITAIDGGNFWSGFVDGMADGALTGGVFALGGAVLRIANIAKQGITIGKTGTFEQIADTTKTFHYSGLKSHAYLKKHFGKAFADKVGWVQNKFIIQSVKFFKGAIYDTGGQLTGAYAKEIALTQGYKFLYHVWLF